LCPLRQQPGERKGIDDETAHFFGGEDAMKDLRISRRQVLKGVGAVTVLGALGVPAKALATGGDAGDSGAHMNFHFAAASQAASPGAKGVVLMAGDGRFTSSHIEGHGMFQHVDTTTPKPNAIPNAGTWQATSLVSFMLVGAYGVQASGILTMKVDLVQDIPSPAVLSATLAVVCNIPFVPLVTGKPEGFSLDAPFGSFKPQTPAVGITLFSTVNEESKGH
jgi:hypothetical protein